LPTLLSQLHEHQQRRKTIKKVLTNLLLVLKAYYPDTYKEMYRK
jgi:hypothetical protein